MTASLEKTSVTSTKIVQATTTALTSTTQGSSTTFSNVVQSISDITVSSDNSNITANKVGQDRRTGLTSHHPLTSTNELSNDTVTTLSTTHSSSMKMTTQITTQTPDAANGNIGIIIGGVIGGAVILVVVFVIVCLYRRKRLLANARGKQESNYPNFNSGFEPESTMDIIDMNIMQPIGGMKFPVAMNDSRYSLFPEFGSNGSSIKSSQSSKSMLSITSNRSKEQKDEHETVSHMNTPSGLMAFLRQSIFKRRSRSLTNIASATENHTINSKSKSLTDLDKDGITKISENVEYRHSAGFPVSNDTIMENNHIQTHDSADDNRNLHDSGIRCDSTCIVENFQLNSL